MSRQRTINLTQIKQSQLSCLPFLTDKKNNRNIIRRTGLKLNQLQRKRCPLTFREKEAIKGGGAI